jgi:hypothetical protein
VHRTAGANQKASPTSANLRTNRMAIPSTPVPLVRQC